jgi:tetratricopeptide (TPR) repeat protein
VASKKLKRIPPKKPQPGKSTSKQPQSTEVKQATPARKNIFATRSLLPGSWQTVAGMFGILTLLTALLYSSDLHLGFFSVDDEYYVQKDQWIKQISFENLKHIFTTLNYSNYSPFHLLSYMFDYAIAGLNPYAFHLSSNIWAGIVAGFVYLVALAFTRNQVAAVGAALLFVVHPSHVEAVAWISSRKDLVATAFALPSLLTYLQYRKGGKFSTRWYIATVALYFIAVLGKASVGVLPVVFWAIDLFVEKRSFKSSILDKVPFFVLTLFVVLVVYVAQPPSGNKFDTSVFSAVMAQSIWLLTGFGKYVVFRLRPTEAGTSLKIASIFFLLLLFVAPLLLRKRFPKTMVLIYWVALGLIPAQVMSFLHPVSDRYLFFPSVAFVILVAWGVVYAAGRLGKKLVTASIVVILLLSFLWVRATLNYLSEWNDPRSIWFAALDKSADPHNPYCLGGYYLEVAGKLGTAPRGERLSPEKAERVATAIWGENPKLPALLTEWRDGKHGGPAEKAFQNELWSLAGVQFDQARQTLGTHVMPELMFKVGTLLLDEGDLRGAKKEFTNALSESELSSVESTKADVIVSSYNALGAIAWRQGNYREAARWYGMGEEQQKKFEGEWIPDIADKKETNEKSLAIMTRKLTPSDKNYDPSIAYSVGLHCLDVANQLGTNPTVKPFSQEICESVAQDVWSGNSELPQLLADWKKQQHGTATEIAFQQYLKNLALQIFGDALTAKGNRVMPQLYFRRGMILAEQGNAAEARKDFFAAIDEAARDTSLSTKQQYTVTAHDAIGIIAWKAANYTEALNWFQKAEQEQNSYGGNWVPDIASKKHQMEVMVNQKK